MMQINLLPWREQERQIKKVNFAISAGVCALVACFCVLITHVYYKSLLNNQLQRNTFLETELAKEQAVLTTLSKKKEQQLADIADLRFVISLQQTGFQMVDFFNALAEVVPDSVTLSRVSREGEVVTIIGKARTNTEITALLQNIEKKPIFHRPELSEISGKEASSAEERMFQLKVRVGSS